MIQSYDLSLCVSLLSMFDFRGDRKVTRQDWVRGTRALTLNMMGEDEKLFKWAIVPVPPDPPGRPRAFGPTYISISLEYASQLLRV